MENIPPYGQKTQPPDIITIVKLAHIARKHNLILYSWKRVPYMDRKHSPLTLFPC
jgi:hypothetical protein